MLKLDNINKTYITKSEEVHALKNVTFSLDSKGMVFINGVSGSGKTTLLNIIGSLDRADSGTIELNGVSYTKLNERELDSFRNEAMGFVFQDYNLINDYNVFDNIGLSLNLQGMNKDERILEALKKVGLEGYAKRKINELSGGQKQRVAIARALVKSPRLILCDEPTGALDQATGNEIFSLLKELSKDCLVIVVSHDKDASKKYADRIINLVDGEIKCDRIINTNIDTEEKLMFNSKAKRLRLRDKLRLSFIMSIKRPIRLAISILLLFLASSVFLSVLASTHKEIDKHLARTITEEVTYLPIKKKVISNEGEASIIRGQDKADLNIVKEKYSPKARVIYNLFGDWRSLSFSQNFMINKPNEEGAMGVLQATWGFMELDSKLTADLGLKLYGRYPESYDEVVITDFLYRQFQLYGYNNNGKLSTISSYDDMIGKSINVNDSILYENGFEKGVDFKVVGIIDTNFNYGRYGGNLENIFLFNETNDMPEYQIHAALFLKPGYYSEKVEKYVEYLYINNNINNIFVEGKSVNRFIGKTDTAGLFTFENASAEDAIYYPVTKIEGYYELKKKYLLEEAKVYYEDIMEEFKKDHYNYSLDAYAWYIERNEIDKYTGIPREARYKSIFEKICNEIKLNAKKISVEMTFDSSPFNFDLVYSGVYNNIGFDNMSDYFCSLDVIQKLKNTTHSIRQFPYKAIIIPVAKSYNGNYALLQMKNVNESREYPSYLPNQKWEDQAFIVYNEYVSNAEEVYDKIAVAQEYLSYALIPMLVILAIYIFYYFNLKIENSIRKIGVLRSQGASKWDIICMFFFADFIYFIATFAFAAVFIAIGSNLINDYIASTYYAMIRFISLEAKDILITFGVIILSFLISTVLPSYKIMRLMPMDAIRN